MSVPTFAQAISSSAATAPNRTTTRRRRVADLVVVQWLNVEIQPGFGLGIRGAQLRGNHARLASRLLEGHAAFDQCDRAPKDAITAKSSPIDPEVRTTSAARRRRRPGT